MSTLMAVVWMRVELHVVIPVFVTRMSGYWDVYLFTKTDYRFTKLTDWLVRASRYVSGVIVEIQW